MNFIKALDISSNGLYAQKKKMEVISQNIANADTLVTENGEPYRKKRAVITENDMTNQFNKVLDNFSQPLKGEGVKVDITTPLEDPFKLLYDPNHPLANENGYVRMPNVDTTEEMIEMMSATRAYEANATVMDATKSMFQKAMEIMK
ncbi:MAG: flagellar basal body rod protein FlgC [Bacillota bacterium]|nr:flagellar basal body rod protein FlgC [Bacillota bacterium]